MTCYLSEPGVEYEISTFFVNILKNRSKIKKMKKPLLENFILFLKINESHFLIKPNFCYAAQEKLDGYHGYWWISRKPHNFTKICGHHWIHLVFLIFLTCPCHEIYRVEAVSLKNSNYTWKIMVFANMWNLGQFREKLIFCQ